MLPTHCLLLFLAADGSSESPVLPGPALISPVLTQSLVSLYLMPAKTSPLGVLPAGPENNALLKGKSVCTQVLPSLFWLEPGASLPANRIPGIPARGMAWEAFQAGWSISCSGSPLQISSYCIPEKGTKSFRACCSSSLCRWRETRRFNNGRLQPKPSALVFTFP